MAYPECSWQGKGRWRGIIFGAVTGCVLLTGAAIAQSYPAKPIRLIITFPPGGSADAVARPVAEQMRSAMGQSFIIDNRPGASGDIGTMAVVRSPADGYTLLLGNDYLALNAGATTVPAYNPVTDLAPIGMIATLPHVMVIHPSIPARDFRELMALSKSKTFSLGSSGLASPGHLLGEFMNLEGTLKLNHVPYKGAGPSIADLLGGTLDIVITTLPGVAPQIKAGKLRGIGVFSARRADSMPDLPTMAESGGPVVAGDVWYGLFAPAGTPGAVIQRLNQELLAALRQQDLTDALKKAGFELGASSPAELGARLKADIEKWGRLLRAAKIEAR